MTSNRLQRISTTSRRRLAALGLVLVLVAAAIGAYAYHRAKPGDVFHPRVAFHAEPAPLAPARGANRFAWPLFGYSKDHARFFPASPALRPPFATRWRFSGRVLLEFPPVIANDSLYQLNDSGVLNAIVADTGHLRWRRRLGTLAAASPAASGASVYVTVLERGRGKPGRVVALRQLDGSVRWSRNLPSRSESSPLLDRGRLYFGSENGTVYALRASDGSVLWTYRAAGAVKGSPTLKDGKLFFGDYANHMQAVRESDGHLVWRTGGDNSVLSGGSFYSTPAVLFGRVFAGNTDGRVYAFEARGGKLAWAKQTGSYVYSSPAVTDVPGLGPTVYVGSYDGTFYALSAFSGTVRWRYRAGGRISGSPTIVGSTVYFADLGRRTTIGLNVRYGYRAFSKHAGSFDPVVSDGRRIYLTGYNGLYRLDPRAAHPPSAPAAPAAAPGPAPGGTASLLRFPGSCPALFPRSLGATEAC